MLAMVHPALAFWNIRHPSEHDEWAGFSVVSGPSAEAGADPGGVGERAFGMRVLLPLGLALPVRRRGASRKGCRPQLEGVEDGSWRGFLAWRGAVPGVDQLLDDDGGDEQHGDHLLARQILGLAQGIDGEALGLERAEQLFDGPAAAVEVGDGEGVLGACRLDGGQQSPVQRRRPGRGIDFADVDGGDLHRGRQSRRGGAVAGPLDLGLDRCGSPGWRCAACDRFWLAAPTADGRPPARRPGRRTTGPCPPAPGPGRPGSAAPPLPGNGRRPRRCRSRGRRSPSPAGRPRRSTPPIARTGSSVGSPCLRTPPPCASRGGPNSWSGTELRPAPEARHPRRPPPSWRAGSVRLPPWGRSERWWCPGSPAHDGR